MIVFDILTGELKFVENSGTGGNQDSYVEFGARSLGDITLDMGERTADESVVDLDLRIY